MYQAPVNFDRGNKRHEVKGYNVLITSVNGTPDTLSFAIVDPCSTLSNQCTAKSILMKAYKDYLAANGGTHAPLESDCVDGVCCDGGGLSVDFYAGTFTLVYTNPGVPVPNAPLTVFVSLPLDCSNIFDSVAYTTVAP